MKLYSAPGSAKCHLIPVSAPSLVPWVGRELLDWTRGYTFTTNQVPCKMRPSQGALRTGKAPGRSRVRTSSIFADVRTINF
eukprot:3234490-Pleurochrysis_carterae.AAC.4